MVSSPWHKRHPQKTHLHRRSPGEHSPRRHTGFLHGRLVSRQVMEEFRRKRKRT
ncbi:hypothetical protein HMPREF1548_05994 [Clostridium sp. KLE 1755]|nr:hypothetical protein HMPREF1548_05994 [Clostridium sp. KLE 1755]